MCTTFGHCLGPQRIHRLQLKSVHQEIEFHDRQPMFGILHSVQRSLVVVIHNWSPWFDDFHQDCWDPMVCSEPAIC